MTPTLFGRWQTRLLLLATVGVIVSIPFAIGLIASSPSTVYFWILVYVAIFGIGWDILYDQLQKYRWDRDWPAAYQLLAGIWEMIFIFCGIKILGFLPIPLPKEELSPFVFLLHYSVVWLAVFIVSQSLMRIIFLRWRFRADNGCNEILDFPKWRREHGARRITFMNYGAFGKHLGFGH